jgi:GNAT superfamily N-acetyltransferase
MILTREMTRNDIPAGIILCRHANWNQVSKDWDTFLRLDPGGCRVAVDETGNVVGTVATMPYQKRFSWIGMVLVHPLYRRQGIGTQLLKEALSWLADSETIKLDATPAGREVYQKLNFVDEYGLVRMHRSAKAVSGAVTTIARPMDDHDFARILKLDHIVFGADRKAILKQNFQSAPQYAFIIEHREEITGFSLGRAGHYYDHIGPIVGQTIDDAIQLLSSVLSQAGTKEMIIDTLQHTPEWISFLSATGFIPSRPLMRMFRGLNLHPGVPEKQYAILGPEFG